MVQIHPIRLHQHPMNSGNRNAVLLCRFANLLPLLRWNFRHVFADRERCDLNRVITGLRREGHRVIERPSLKNLVANGEFHFSLCSSRPTTCPFFALDPRARPPPHPPPPPDPTLRPPKPPPQAARDAFRRHRACIPLPKDNRRPPFAPSVPP